MEEYKEIERSIITKYRKDIWSKFVKAVQDYKLINDNIVGKSIFKINKFGKIYDAIISPFMLVIVVIGMIIYFILTPERN